MKSRACSQLFFIASPRPLIHAPHDLRPDKFAARRLVRTFHLGSAAAIVFLAFAFAPARITAQQGYPASPYGYSSPYAQPSPQYGYAQPQYGQPPQYRQPQYAPQQQPYAQQPYAQQPYAQQPYAQQPYAQELYSGQQSEVSPYAQQQDLGQSAPAPVQALSAQDLEQLLAPVALYPDALLAEMLAASTYPGQVAVADEWLQQMRAQGYGSPDQIAAGAQAHADWDPSIKALAAFPDVLDMLDHNLEWTTNLGNAYYNQPQDVMQTVQVLRQRAEQAGNLESTPQQYVTNDQGYIQLAPPNPQVVYVPTYDPWAVYGQPISPYPGFSLFGALGSFFGSTPIQYGLGFAMSAFERTPFGLLAWGLDWLAHAILFDHGNYYSHSTTVADWGLPHGGPRAYGGNWGGSRMRDGPYGASREGASRAWNGQNAGSRQQPGRQQAYSQRGPDQRGFEQRGYDQRGYDQRGGAYSNRAPAQSQLRPTEPFREAQRPGNYDNRGSQQPAYGYTHPALPAQNYDRPALQQYARVAPQQSYRQSYPNRPQAYAGQTYASRPQIFSNPGNGYSNRTYSGNAYSGQAYAAHPNYGYSNPYSYRAPQSNSSRAFASRSYEGYGGSIARNDRSGGFHPFGGGKEPKGFGGGREPKFKAPKNFGGGGHERAPKMSHSGGHSGGGGGGHHHR